MLQPSLPLGAFASMTVPQPQAAAWTESTTPAGSEALYASGSTTEFVTPSMPFSSVERAYLERTRRGVPPWRAERAGPGKHSGGLLELALELHRGGGEGRGVVAEAEHHLHLRREAAHGPVQHLGHEPGHDEHLALANSRAV